MLKPILRCQKCDAAIEFEVAEFNDGSFGICGSYLCPNTECTGHADSDEVDSLIEKGFFPSKEKEHLGCENEPCEVDIPDELWYRYCV